MTDVLKSSAQWLEAMRTEHAASDVDYSRAAAGSTVFAVVLPATVGHTDFDITDENGLTTNLVTRDFLVLRADLRLDGEEVEPNVGDRIAETDGAVYEVMSPGGDIPHWRWSDPYRTTYRIHTTRVTKAT